MLEGERKLAAIMFTDMVGYTALGQRNETLSLAMVEEHRRIVRPLLSKHGGREVKTIGDAFLVEFPNALDAVRCAYDIQRALRELNLSLASDKRIHLRIGIHVGEVVESEGDISGDSVNVASRIEALAEDGGVCITRQVYDHVHNKVDLRITSLGLKSLKNVSEPLEVFNLMMPWIEARPQSEATLDIKRVAVLPFSSLSPDPNDEFLADGVTEEVISTVSGISGLEVISRTSVMGYKGTTKRVKEIGRELEVGSVLEGSFRKAGNRIRVAVQLIDVTTDKHLWSQSYDRQLDDVFAVQSDIARQVADALRVRILTREIDRLDMRPTASSKAHISYLRGRYHWNRREAKDLTKAAEYFEESVRDDANFALGYVGLADCYELLSANLGVNRSDNHQKAIDAVAKALNLDPDLAEAHATRGLVLSNDFDFQGAEKELQRAIELKPNYASAHQWYMHVLVAQSRPEEARREIEKAVELDPLSVAINTNLSDYYFYRRDYARALEVMKKSTELAPDSPFTHFVLAVRYAKVGMRDEARKERDTAVQLGQASIPSIGMVADAAIARAEGDKQAVKGTMPGLENLFGSPLFPRAVVIAGYYFWLGEYDKGFEWLERSYASKETMLVMIRDGEDFDDVRSNPKFVDVFRRIGL